MSMLGQHCSLLEEGDALGWHCAADSGAELGRPRNLFAPNGDFSILRLHAAGAISNSTRNSAVDRDQITQRCVSLTCSAYRPDKSQGLTCT